MLSGTGLSGSDRDDKVSNRLDTSKEAVVSNKDVEKSHQTCLYFGIHKTNLKRSTVKMHLK